MRKVAENSSPKHPVLSVAPMIDWTDRHCRVFHRLLSPNALLYTEMITTSAILNGDRNRLLGFSDVEHPVALQLGGSDLADLATCAKIGEDFGYDAINLNCGCPSDRVQKGAFGACLMADPQLVADSVAAMKAAVNIPVTVKCRIGIDDSDDYNFLEDFIKKISAAGCDTFIIHARKAWLKGLSPKENREIPPLRYDIAAEIKKNYPNLTIILNGGLTKLDHIQDALKTFDGVMIGREAYNNPYFLTEMELALYGTPQPDRIEICEKMIPYIESQSSTIHSTTRHMLGLFNGMRGARSFRQILSTEVHTATSTKEIVQKALSALQQTT
ncbi:MAG: tRNA dihydrouridine(20/20a) synthase DusA [Alphaproteobacteria bacterium RIFCSPHIGHO2_12_FULL_45_9]|nr:MAG: tRNA dihydrouridine(20/20a) synthase DusA [Alphaproteobacteria bacterium RIFCSPHIGHO2_12_FULL_45_9]